MLSAIALSAVVFCSRLLRESIADGVIENSSVPVNAVPGGEAGIFERFGSPAMGLGLTLFWLANE